MPRNNTATTEVAQPITRDRALEAYPGMVMAIPEAEASDGSGIIAQALMATTWEQLNEDSESLPNAEDMIGVPFVVERLSRRQSDIEGGIGWYLVVEGTNTRTGEQMTWQTSSATVMAKLVKLSQLAAYPATVETYRVAKATRAGMFPLDLKVTAATTNGHKGY